MPADPRKTVFIVDGHATSPEEVEAAIRHVRDEKEFGLQSWLRSTTPAEGRELVKDFFAVARALGKRLERALSWQVLRDVNDSELGARLRAATQWHDLSPADQITVIASPDGQAAVQVAHARARVLREHAKANPSCKSLTACVRQRATRGEPRALTKRLFSVACERGTDASNWFELDEADKEAVVLSKQGLALIAKAARGEPKDDEQDDDEQDGAQFEHLDDPRPARGNGQIVSN